ncbi:MAG: RNA polymerase sigma factor [Lachnospiraceae bacterium]|nr:RNA polymerase sigma factor [Lachnospiraceae bacterium]
MQDDAIVALYWQRDESAIRETQDKYGHYLTKIAYNILSDLEDSMESVNDTYLHAWNSMPPHRPSILSTYLAKITRRVSIDIFRRHNRQKRQASQYTLSLDELNDCLSNGNTTEQTADSKLLAQAISSYLRSLPEEARTLFISRYFFLDSLKEAAALCHMSESKAKSMLHRTRQGLQTHLRKEGFLL